MFWIVQNLLRRCSHSRLARGIGFLELDLIRKIYWVVCCRFQRVVQPGGFIERDLTLSMASDSYHIVNLKDLLTLYEQASFDWLRPYIVNGTAFIRKLVHKIDITNAIRHSPLYIEFIDMLYLYHKFIEHVSSEEINSLEGKIYQQTGGVSLDYHASELVRSWHS